MFLFFKDNKSTIEILEEIDKDISRLEKFSRSNQEMRSRVNYKYSIFYSCA